MYALVSGHPFHEIIVGCFSTYDKAQQEKVQYAIARIQEFEVK
ncbi:hypothetical protein MHB42_08665 [Lysinibacillus sp. FSL K6-0232]